MCFEELEITWLAAAVLFGFGQAIVAIVLSLSPKHVDDVISYFEWLIKPLNQIVRIGFLALFFAIIMTWIYCFTSCRHPTFTGVAICIVITILSVLAFIYLKKFLKGMILSKLRPSEEDPFV